MNEVVERADVVHPWPAHALGGLLGVPVPDLEAGAALPLLWHWLYLLERPAQADLGADGHPVRGVLPVPPKPGLRRMWAGGSVRSLAPMRCGEAAVRRSAILSTQTRKGRSGRLTFVAVEHRISQGGRPVIVERQDLVYREPDSTPSVSAPVQAGRQNDPAPSRPASRLAGANHGWSIDVTPTLLFRFSALTYNAHRIHFDAGYARDVEGYPGLVVHGPLQALAMAEAARASGAIRAPRVRFDYRLVAPLCAHEGMIVDIGTDVDRVVATVRDTGGRETAHATLARDAD